VDHKHGKNGLRLQAARDAVHDAERVKKDVESARKENEAGAMFAAATAATAATAAALPTPRQLQLGTPGTSSRRGSTSVVGRCRLTPG